MMTINIPITYSNENLQRMAVDIYLDKNNSATEV